MSLAKWKNTLKYLAALMLLAFTIASLYQIIGYKNNVVSPENLVFFKQQHATTLTKNGTIQGCNLFSGKWVYDDVSYPLYKERSCALMEEQFACEKNGRKNLKYQNWRWQPHHCDLPRFDGIALLEKLRDKKLVFVGDSLCRNQWRSLLCLIDPYFPLSTNKTVYNEGNFFSLHVKDYNATIAFYWSPYLVESSSDNIFRHNKNVHSVRIKSIEKHGRHWINADILIFDSFVWWYFSLTIFWSPFDSPNPIYKNVTSLRPYEIALNTWAEWLEFHVDRNKTRIFFMSASPFRPGKSNGMTSAECYNTTEPIIDDTFWGVFQKFRMKYVESTLEKLEERGVKVVHLNITRLSFYREDAHPSIYMPYWKKLDPTLKDPSKRSDCLHWCLPGVPDVWNQILYAYIMKPLSFNS